MAKIFKFLNEVDSFLKEPLLTKFFSFVVTSFFALACAELMMHSSEAEFVTRAQDLVVRIFEYATSIIFNILPDAKELLSKIFSAENLPSLFCLAALTNIAKAFVETIKLIGGGVVVRQKVSVPITNKVSKIPEFNMIPTIHNTIK